MDLNSWTNQWDAAIKTLNRLWRRLYFFHRQIVEIEKFSFKKTARRLWVFPLEFLVFHENFSIKETQNKAVLLPIVPPYSLASQEKTFLATHQSTWLSRVLILRYVCMTATDGITDLERQIPHLLFSIQYDFSTWSKCFSISLGDKSSYPTSNFSPAEHRKWPVGAYTLLQWVDWLIGFLHTGNNAVLSHFIKILASEFFSLYCSVIQPPGGQSNIFFGGEQSNSNDYKSQRQQDDETKNGSADLSAKVFFIKKWIISLFVWIFYWLILNLVLCVLFRLQRPPIRRACAIKIVRRARSSSATAVRTTRPNMATTTARLARARRKTRPTRHIEVGLGSNQALSHGVFSFCCKCFVWFLNVWLIDWLDRFDARCWSIDWLIDWFDYLFNLPCMFNHAL